MKKNIITKNLDDELMLYDSDKDNLHVLNSSARLIYNLYTKGKDIGEIVGVLKDEFKISNGVDLENDIKNCIYKLKEKGLIVK